MRPAAALTPFPVAETGRAAKPETDSDSIKKHHILFVDDSLAFLETFGELCSVFANNDVGNSLRRDGGPGAGHPAGKPD